MSIGAAALAAVLVAAGGVAWAASGDDGHPASAHVATRTHAGSGSVRTTTTTGPSATSSTTTTTTTTLTAGAAAASAAVPTPSVSSPSTASSGAAGGFDEGPAIDAKVTIVQSGGACRFDGDAGELVDSGTVHNPGSDDAIVEIDVSFVDATGELDSASDVEQVGPGETVEWEVSTIAFDPPEGSLSCDVTQS